MAHRGPVTEPEPVGSRRLVGRDAEIATLRAVLDERRGAAVIGPAGMGKTSLCGEAVADRPGVQRGGALALLSYVPYLALARATGSSLGQGRSVTPDRVAREVIERVGDGVLVLDDLHWAAPETLALLPRLAGSLRLVVTVRTGEPGTERAIAATTDARLDRLDLGPLGAADAGTLLDRLGVPAIPEVREAILAAAQGNPFVLEELSAAPSTGTPALAASLRSRLRRLGAGEREAAELLALLGRPAEPGVLPGAAAALVEAGLAHGLPDGSLELRHPLVTEAIRAELEPRSITARHRTLAAAVTDPGERARHLAAAGDRRQAHDLALEAARSAALPGERGRNLALAAATADGPVATRLALEAGRLLVEANDHEAVLALLEPLRCASADEEAERALVLGLGAFASGDMPAYRRHVAAGLEIARGTGSTVEIELELATAEIAAWEWDAGEAPRRATHALELALRADTHVARARVLRASAAWVSMSDETPTLAEEALAAALAEGDVSTEARARQILVQFVLNDSGVDACRPAWEAFERRVAELGQEALAADAGIVWLVENGVRHGGCGWVDEALDRVRTRRAGTHEAYTWAWIVTAVADAGDDRRALALLEECRSVVRQESGAAAIRWAEAEAHLAAGRVSEARAVLTTLPGDDGDVRLARAVIAFQDRSPPPAQHLSTVRWPTRHRLAGETIAALAHASDPARAAEAGTALEALAGDWEPHMHRNAVRCLWAAGETARRAGQSARAADLLQRAEGLAEAGRNVPLLAAIRRSLVEAGVRRRRQVAGGLTARERDVLELVGAGHASPEIARRLGLSRQTVDGYVTTAMRKLGASTRAQAAAIISAGS